MSSASIASAILIAHSWLRLLVVFAALLVVIRATVGMNGRKPWTKADATGLRALVSLLDLQLLLGLIMYVVASPVIGGAFQNIGAAMRNGNLRFFLVEHPFGMLVAIALAHVGSVKVRKAADAAAKYRLALTFVLIALIVILVSIPWPGTPGDRPMLRFSAAQ